MKEQSDKFKHLLLGGGKLTYDKISNIQISEYINVILEEIAKVHESLDNGTDNRYVAITSLHITQRLSSFEHFAQYLQTSKISLLEDRNKSEIISAMRDICKCADLFHNAIFIENIFSAILRLDELELLLNHLKIYLN